VGAVKAIDYIRKGWTQNYAAKDANGKSVACFDSNAVCWCALGAIRAAYPEHGGGEARRKLREIIGDSEASISDWNDALERTHAEVIEAFEKAEI
jgi:hypothetical protein